MRQFTAADDLLHDITGRPNGRESLFWVIPLPDQGLATVAYLWRDADTGRYGRLVGVADQVAAKPLFFDLAGDLDLEGDDLDDCVVGGLRLRQPEPLQTAELAFSGEGVDLECTFTGLHAPFSWHDGAGGCFPWAADDRFEQSVRTQGSITIGGRKVDFTGVGHRDHSWGTRDWRALQHWKWMNATALDESVSIHAWISFAFGDRQINGYVNRGGEVTPISVADATAVLNDDFMHTAVSAAFATGDGREVRLEATSVAGLPIHARHIQMNEIAFSATLDGRPAVAHIEFGWPMSYIQEFTGGGA